MSEKPEIGSIVRVNFGGDELWPVVGYEEGGTVSQLPVNPQGGFRDAVTRNFAHNELEVVKDPDPYEIFMAGVEEGYRMNDTNEEIANTIVHLLEMGYIQQSVLPVLHEVVNSEVATKVSEQIKDD